MLCPTCFGHRLFYYQGRIVPCPECEGHGALHCCDGLQAQPDEPPEPPRAPDAPPRAGRQLAEAGAGA